MLHSGLNECDCDDQLSSLSAVTFDNLNPNNGFYYLNFVRNLGAACPPGTNYWDYLGNTTQINGTVLSAHNLTTFDYVPKYTETPDPNFVSDLFSTCSPCTLTVTPTFPLCSGTPRKANVSHREQNSRSRLIIYPNPANAELKIEKNDYIGGYKIINVYGQIVLQGNFSNDVSLDLSFLPFGIYVVQLDNFESEKIIRIK